MKRFQLIRQTRQTTEYSCGACALQSVLGYWGREVDEAELMQRLGKTPEEGTYPDHIVRVARELGFAAELKKNLTVNDVERATNAGHPVIVLGQAWRSRGHSDAAAEDVWADGHYFIVLAVDRDHVYFEDPYMRMGKGFMPRAAFDALWHNVMGGDLAKPRQMRMGIFIRGEKPAAPQRLSDADFSALDFASLGSMNLLVAQFGGYLLPYPFISELSELWAGGIVRPDAYIVLRKDVDGKVAAIEGGGTSRRRRTGPRSTRCSRRSRAWQGAPPRKPRPAPSWPPARQLPISAFPSRSCSAWPTSCHRVTRPSSSSSRTSGSASSGRP